MGSVWQKGVVLKERWYLAGGTVPKKILRREMLQGWGWNMVMETGYGSGKYSENILAHKKI
jgi:hypothetical protein